MFWGITLILLSIIAVPSLILSKKPNAEEFLEKIEPFQGYVGLIFFFLGVWGIVSSFVLHIGWLTTNPIWWTTLLVGNIIETTLCFMLGFGLISKFLLFENETEKEKGNQLREKLAPKLGSLGFVGLAMGAWIITASFLYF